MRPVSDRPLGLYLKPLTPAPYPVIQGTVLRLGLARCAVYWRFAPRPPRRQDLQIPKPLPRNLMNRHCVGAVVISVSSRAADVNGVSVSWKDPAGFGAA